MPEKRMLIAVDFGTTYTGVAYSDPHKGDDQEPILFTYWPKHFTDKVPSIIGTNRSSNGNYPFKWGHEVKDGDKRHEWFKLGLDPMKYKAYTSVDMSYYFPSKREQASQENYEKESKQHTVDFLTAIRKHVTAQLEVNYRMRLSNIGIDWMVTVPAIWSTQAKNTTKECASAAGMGTKETLLMAMEPEAAANHSLEWLKPQLSGGEKIMILDAGGGTVDLITYVVTQLDPFQVEESGICTGGKCGGVFVNRAFERLVTTKLSELGVNPSQATLAEIVKNFENCAKREFDVSVEGEDDEDDEDDDGYFYTVPGIKNNRLQVSNTELKAVFDQVIDNVIYLVRCQMHEMTASQSYGNTYQPALSALILVGGFGECSYLYQRLQAEPCLSGVQIHRCDRAVTAIARGAVRKGLRDRSATTKTVVSRKSPVHLGVKCSQPFVEGHHQPYGFYHEIEQAYYCSNLFKCHVQRGDDLKENTPIFIDFGIYFKAKSSSFVANWQIFESSAVENSGYTDNCKLLGELKADLSSIPKDELERKRDVRGKLHYYIEHQIAVTFRSADLSLADFELYYQGQSYGRAEFHFSNAAQLKPTPRPARR